MLKKYLQALLEAFIGSKKEWVSSQALPGLMHSEENRIGLGFYETVISPINGFALIDSSGVPTGATTRIRITANIGNQQNLSSSTLRNSKSGGSCWVPCREGESLFIFVEKDFQYKLQFFNI